MADYPCFITNCGGTIVVRKSRGHDEAGCDRCHRCVSLVELLGEVARLRARNSSMRDCLRGLLAKIDAALGAESGVTE